MTDNAEWRPSGCISCNVNPDDVVEITEYGDHTRRWCCSQCDAVWIEAPAKDGRLYIVIAEGFL